MVDWEPKGFDYFDDRSELDVTYTGVAHWHARFECTRCGAKFESKEDSGEDAKRWCEHLHSQHAYCNPKRLREKVEGWRAI